MTRQSTLWKSTGTKVDKDTLDSNAISKDNLADFIFLLKKDNITYNLVMNLFGEFNGKSLANPYDLLEVPAGTFFYFADKEKTKKKTNTNKFTTTVGLYLWNIFMRDFNFLRFFNGYIDYTITKKKYGGIEQILSYALIEDDITTKDLMEFEDTVEWFMPFETILTPNHTEKMITATKVINKKKKELLKKYAKEIEEGDPVAAERMEKELLDFAQEYLGDDPSMDQILSNAGGNFGNNFKNMYVMKGAIRNPDPNAKKKYTIVTGNYMDGIEAKEYSAVAGAGVQGAYSRGKKTEVGGYFEKLFVASFQDLILDKRGSDCGTKHYITVNLTADNIGDYMYCYVIGNNGKLTCITSKNKDSFIGKKVKLRFASMCESKTGLCNMCAGELFYLLDDTRVGLTMAQIPDRLKLVSMKSWDYDDFLLIYW